MRFPGEERIVQQGDLEQGDLQAADECTHGIGDVAVIEDIVEQYGDDIERHATGLAQVLDDAGVAYIAQDIDRAGLYECGVEDRDICRESVPVIRATTVLQVSQGADRRLYILCVTVVLHATGRLPRHAAGIRIARDTCSANIAVARHARLTRASGMRLRTGRFTHHGADLRHDVHLDELLVEFAVQCVDIHADMLVEQFEDDQADFQAGFDAVSRIAERVANGFRAHRVLEAFQVDVTDQETDAFVQCIERLYALAADLVDQVGNGKIFFEVVLVHQSQVGIPVQAHSRCAVLRRRAGYATVKVAFELRQEIVFDVFADNA